MSFPPPDKAAEGRRGEGSFVRHIIHFRNARVWDSVPEDHRAKSRMAGGNPQHRPVSNEVRGPSR